MDERAVDALAARVAGFESPRGEGEESASEAEWSIERALGVLGHIAAFGHARWLTETAATFGTSAGDPVTDAWILADARLEARLTAHLDGHATELISALDQRAAIALALGDTATARDTLRFAQERATASWGEGHSSAPGRLAQLATCHARLGALAESERVLGEALVALRHIHGLPPAELLGAVSALLDAATAAGDAARAARVRTRAAEELEARLGADHEWVRELRAP